jgi:hypothetical protein
MVENNLGKARQLAEKIIHNIEKVMVGKPEAVDDAGQEPGKIN